MEKTITMTTSDLYSVAEAAKELNKPKLTIYRWIDSGKIIALRFGSIKYVPKSEVDRLKEVKNAI